MKIQQEVRITRAAQIVSMGGPIEHIDDTIYKVASQSNPNRYYEIPSTEHGLICSYLDHMYHDMCCKHIHAVEISRWMREVVQQDVPKTIIKVADPVKYKFCESANVTKKDTRYLKHLHRYVNEFAGSLNIRDLDTIFIMITCAQYMAGKRLTYKALINGV